MKNRRLHFWILLFLFLALAGWWSVYFPYDPVRVCRAIPANALFASEHDRLDQRLDDILASPLGRSAVQIAGINDEEVREFRSDPVIAKIFAPLARRKTVFAYVPALDTAGRPAWVFSSWGGAKAQILRWALSLGLMRDFKKVPSDFGYHVWTLKDDNDDTDFAHFSIAVLDGIIAGCFSEDPAGARFLENRILRGSPVIPFLDREADRAALSTRTKRDSHPDWFWAGSQWPVLWDLNIRDITAGITIERDQDSVGKINVQWRGRTSEFLSGLKQGIGASELSDIVALERRLGDAPALLAMVPVSTVRALLVKYGRPRDIAPVLTILDENASTNSLLALSLLGQEHSGIMWHLRVPALVASLTQCRPGFPNRLRPELDLLNSQYGLGLIPRKAETPIGPLTLLDSIEDDRFGGAGSRQGPALAERDDVLFLSTSATALESVLTGPRTQPPVWANGFKKEGGDCKAYAWTDIGQMAKPMGDLLAMNLLARKLGGHSGSESALVSLNLFNSWIAALHPLDQLRLHVTQAGPSLEMQFRITPNPPAK